MAALSGTHYVNGTWMAGSGARHDVIDPATGKASAQYADATKVEVDQAVAHAARAQAEWWAMSALDRANALHEAARKMIKNSPRSAGSRGNCVTAIQANTDRGVRKRRLHRDAVCGRQHCGSWRCLCRELAIGAHAANNISAALLVGYVGSAIPSLSLWTMDRIPVMQEVVLGLVSAAVFAWLTSRTGGAQSRKGEATDQ